MSSHEELPPEIIDILPCPCCGNVAHLCQTHHLDEQVFWVECLTCNVRTRLYSVSRDDREDAWRVVVEEWNKRQPQPVAPAPDWSQAPEWAMWFAVDASGDAHWYDAEPLVLADAWAYKGVNSLFVSEIDIPIGIDWRLLKYQRPAEQEAT